MRSQGYPLGVISSAFARQYAYNLRRSWRAVPELAKSDAIYTVEALLVIPAAVLCGLLYLLLTKLLPNSISHLDSELLKVIGGLGLFAAWFWIDQKLDRIEVSTALIDWYSTTAEQRKKIYLYAIDLVIVLLGGICAYLLDRM